jgi:hypothetical protein
MRTKTLSAVIAVVACCLLVSPSSRAARDQATARPSQVTQELIVLEAPNCAYCTVFRQDVLPRYQRSPRAGDVPIRFLDLNDPAADKLKLDAAVTMVPTVVLMRDGIEAGRITGYWGPDAFFKGIAKMLGSDAE